MNMTKNSLIKFTFCRSDKNFIIYYCKKSFMYIILMLILICNKNQYHDFFKKNINKQAATSNIVLKIKETIIAVKTAVTFSRNKKTIIKKTFNKENKSQDYHDDDKNDKK